MGDNSYENNKRIAKNTLFLYFRMILVMGVTLFTSRIVLNSLGVEGYGLYNVIGGVVALFTVISGSLSSAISRYITYELGRENLIRLKSIFSNAVLIQIILCGCIIVIFSPIGVWFISNKMTIPSTNHSAALWVFGFSVATFCLNLMSVPYNAVIISHEKMAVFSYVSIIEVILKLVVAYIITLFSYHRIILYAAMLFGVSFVIQSIYMWYCNRKFVECKLPFVLDKNIIREMGGFAGWNFIGAASNVLRNQGNNIILNIFFGTVVNAAYGITMQVNSAVTQLADNFMVSVNPQITKYYAVGELEDMHRLIIRSAKLSFFLTWPIAILILVNTRYILELWLVNVPSYTVIFVQLIMLFAISESMSRPLITAMLATGNIRNYQIVVGGLQMLNLPVSYLLLRHGAAAYWPIALSVIISQICFGARLWLLRGMIRLRASQFLKDVYLKAANIILVSLLIPFLCHLTIGHNTNLIIFGIESMIYVVWTSIAIYFLGLTHSERIFILDKAKSVTHKLFNHD